MSQIVDKSDVKDLFLTAFYEQGATLLGGSSAGIHAVRKNAIAHFEKVGLPTLKNEAYRYTPIAKALSKNIQSLNTKSVPETNSAAHKAAVENSVEANKIVFVNGHFSKALSELENDIEITHLMDAQQDKADLLERYFSKIANDEEDAFTALNTAFAQHGVVLDIPDHKVIRKPLMIYYITDTAAGTTFYQPRNLFVVGKNSQVDIIEYFITLGEHFSFCNHVSEIYVSESAHVTYYKIQQEGKATHHVGTTQVYQEKQSIFSAVTVTLSGGILRNNLNITVDGERCEANMYGLYLLKDREHVDNHTVVDHRQPNTQSNELYKGVLDGASTGVFNGKIFVRSIAQKTNAFQSNRNILLTNDASMNTKPQLEIWADDVKCSHGATTGQINEEQLFYLRSRGIDEDTARAMLLYAFAIDVLSNIKIPALKDELDQIISKRLAGGLA